MIFWLRWDGFGDGERFDIGFNLWCVSGIDMGISGDPIHPINVNIAPIPVYHTISLCIDGIGLKQGFINSIPYYIILRNLINIDIMRCSIEY